MIYMYLFGLAGVIILARMLKGPTVGDRLIMLNLVGTLVIFLTVWYSIQNQLSMYLDVAITLTLLSFVGLISIARWLRR